MHEDIHKLLEDFDKYWNDSLNGKYRPTEVIRIAKNIYKAEFDKHQLSLTEQLVYHQAILLYECIGINKKKYK
jgi:hypothetical protein